MYSEKLAAAKSSAGGGGGRMLNCELMRCVGWTPHPSSFPPFAIPLCRRPMWSGASRPPPVDPHGGDGHWHPKLSRYPPFSSLAFLSEYLTRYPHFLFPVGTHIGHRMCGPFRKFPLFPFYLFDPIFKIPHRRSPKPTPSLFPG